MKKYDTCKYILYILSILLIILGFYFIIMKTENETFVDGKCPTTMIKDGQRILVYDPKLAKVPGVNPIVFNNLDEYKEYVKWQKKNKLNCPILFLEKTFDTQGNEMYQIKQSFDTDIPTGAMNHSLPVINKTTTAINLLNKDDSYFNSNSYPPYPYDKDNQEIGNVGKSEIILYPNSENLNPIDYIRR
jgi:hypothetical protein